MISRAIFVGIFLILGGCLGGMVQESRIPDQRDISTSDATVTIFGSGSGVNGLRCYPEIEGQRYRKIIMDAGDASLTVTCRQYNEYGPAVRADVTFEFVADAGHEYKLIGYVYGCFGCGKSCSSWETASSSWSITGGPRTPPRIPNAASMPSTA